MEQNHFLAYRTFWEENLQKLEEISAHIEKHILSLEKKHLTKKEEYYEIEKAIDLLLSIYSSYNCLKGREYLLKLKSCLAQFRHHAESEKTRFNTIYYLMAKARELQAESFKDFPKITHEHNEAKKNEIKNIIIPASSLTYRWITFRKNRQWFITPYNTYTIIEKQNCHLFTNKNGNSYLVYNNSHIKLLVQNISPNYDDNAANFYIIVYKADSSYCFAVTEIGKRIAASKDIITPKLKEYRSVKLKYIKMFGKNHLYMDENALDYFSPYAE